MLLATVALAAPPPPLDPALALQEAKIASRRGGIAVAAGAAGVTGGLLVMAVGRGPSGGISTETQAMSDVRSIGGGLLLIGGLTSALVGSTWLSDAQAWRERAADAGVSLVVAPNAVGVRGWF